MNVYPSFGGYVWTPTITPVWNSQVQKTVTGRVVAATYQQYPLYKFSVQYAYLAQSDFQTLLAFFNQQQGNVVPFWFDAGPGNDSVTAQVFATADGTTKTYQLTRSYGGFAEPIAAVNGTPSIYVNGALQTAGTNYTLNAAAGTVTFTSAPTSGYPLSWTGSYYFQCRFSKGSADIEQFMYQLYKTKTVEMETYW